jgi:predicted transcriptional regulator
MTMTTSKLSTCQEQILVQLVSSAKSVEELRQRTGFAYGEIMDAVKGLLLQHAIERKKGFPTAYRITKEFQLVAKKLRAKFDMSDLLDDPCDIFAAHLRESKSRENEK